MAELAEYEAALARALEALESDMRPEEVEHVHAGAAAMAEARVEHEAEMNWLARRVVLRRDAIAPAIEEMVRASLGPRTQE